eukprot:TRINITY_DN4689_c0_g1_i3.p1 TRINITY_DN4689_c0_g1~~TRINITY_DN4689_c0_g1_i3.p1  ORF type:complete len:117 (-),score=55.85 TRINITY_DN4689_c0_g1_i3:75-425(-)
MSCIAHLFHLISSSRCMSITNAPIKIREKMVKALGKSLMKQETLALEFDATDIINYWAAAMAVKMVMVELDHLVTKLIEEYGEERLVYGLFLKNQVENQVEDQVENVPMGESEKES